MLEIEKRQLGKLQNVYYNVIGKSNLSSYKDLNVRLKQDFAPLEQYDKKNNGDVSLPTSTSK